MIRSIRSKFVLLAFALSLCAATAAFAGLPIIVASDSANDPAYAPQPDQDYIIDNGGFGYHTWTLVNPGAGGGFFMEGPTVNNRGIPTPADYSFAVSGPLGSGSFAISRPLASLIVGMGEFDIYTRFDMTGSGNNLLNLRTGNNTSTFGGGELLSFGLVNAQNNPDQLTYTDGSGFHTIATTFDVRGQIFSWNVDFDSTAGTYSLSVLQVGGTFADTVTGNLEANNTNVGSFAVIDSSTGNNQNLIFNDPVFSVPEPSTIAAGVFALFGTVWMRGRRRRKARIGLPVHV